jgi:hypothetical protein
MAGRDGLLTPRLLTLAQAQAYCGGKHPSRFNWKPVRGGPGAVCDLQEIKALLDTRLDGLGLMKPARPVEGPANDDGDASDELKILGAKIEAAGGI